jgi:hypothetical protein
MASLKVDLVNEHGASIKSLRLNGDTASFDLPSAKAFKIRLSGKTLDGTAFQRTSHEIKPQIAIIRTQLDQSLLTIRRGITSSFSAAIDYVGRDSKTFDLIVTVSPNNVHISRRSSVTVTNASPGDVTVDLTALADTPVGTVVKLYIQAKSGDIELNNVAHLMVK